MDYDYHYMEEIGPDRICEQIPVTLEPAIYGACIRIPQPYRKYIKDDEIWFVGNGAHQTLNIYSWDEWAALEKRLVRATSKDNRKFCHVVRFFVSGIAESIIHDGRLYIPDHLLERAGIEKVGLLLAVRENDGIRFVLTNAGGLYASGDQQMSGE